MNKSSKLRKYAELFNRYIEKYLAPNISIKATVYPVDGPGAIFEFVFNSENDSGISVVPAKQSIGAVLSSIPQKMVAGNVENVSFGGTNIYMEGNRLLLIKGDDESARWEVASIHDDVRRVVSTSQGGK